MTARKPLVITAGQIEALQTGDTLEGFVATISTNTTYHVTTGGNDTTGDGSSGLPWLTIGKAFSYLADKWIPAGVSVTIQVGDGNFAISSPISVNHPCADRITLTGQNTYDKDVASIQSSSGSAGARSYVLNVNNVTSIATNDYVIIRTVIGGTNPSYISGCHQITNVDAVNTRITIAVTHENATAASGATAATASVIKTRVSATGCDGLITGVNTALGFVDKIVLVGDLTGGKSGFCVHHPDVTNDATTSGQITFGSLVGSVFFTTGLSVNGGGTSGTPVVSSNLGTGISVGNGGRVTSSPGVCASGNGSSGVVALNGSLLSSSGGVLTGNGAHGAHAGGGSSVLCAVAHITGNIEHGIVAADHSNLSVDLGTVTNNGNTGVRCDSHSSGSASSASITNNTVGIGVSNNCYIAALGSSIGSNTTNFSHGHSELLQNGSCIDIGNDTTIAYNRGYRTGFLWFRDGTDTANDIDIFNGRCRDDADTQNIVFVGEGPRIKRLDAAWAFGSNQGCLDTGARAANTWYWLWAIKNPTSGEVDILASTSVTTPTMPTGYTVKRRVGAIRTNATNLQIIDTRTLGGGEEIYVRYTNPADNGLDVSVTNLSTTRTTFSLNHVPVWGNSIFTSTKFDANIACAHATINNSVYVANPDHADSAPAGAATPLRTIDAQVTNQPNHQIAVLYANRDGDITARASAASTTFRCQVLGWWWSDNVG